MSRRIDWKHPGWKSIKIRLFGIWPTLSEPVQVRIGILNLLTQKSVTDIVNRFAQAIRDLGGSVDDAFVNDALNASYNCAVAAE